MAKMKIGIQMWSINDICMQEGLPHAFRMIRDIGYEGFEFALGDCAALEEKCGMPADQVKKAADDVGLQLLGTHLSFDHLMKDPNPIIAECKELGLPYAAIGPAFWGDRTPFAEQKKIYQEVKKLAELFKKNGIQLQVHCSAFGYLRDHCGRHVVDGMFEEAGLENLQPEFDTAWMICGGVIPTVYLQKYAGYVDLLHFKDFHPPMEDSDYLMVRHNEVNEHHKGCAVGDNGIQDLSSIVAAAQKAGTKWVLVELWNESNSLENAEISLQNLQKYL